MFEELKRLWEQNKLKINGPLPNCEIDHFEKQHHLILPASFKQYLLVVNGMQQYESDDELISFFSLAEMSERLNSRKFNPLGEFLFADYSIGSHGYILDLTNNKEDVLATDYGGNHKLLATSFKSFMNLYLTNRISVANCW